MKRLMIDFFTSFFDKASDSNLSKIIQIVSDEIETFKFEANRIDEWRMIDRAEGKALDKIGEEYSEFRGQADDNFYRYLIKSKIVQRSIDGSVNKIISIINQTLNVPLDQIKVTNLRNGPNDLSEIQAIGIDGLPEEYFLATNVSEKFIERISNSVAAGIALERIFFESNNRTSVYCSAGIVTTEIVLITHDVVRFPEIKMSANLASANVSTSVETWSMDVKQDERIKVELKNRPGVTILETIEIH